MWFKTWKPIFANKKNDENVKKEIKSFKKIKVIKMRCYLKIMTFKKLPQNYLISQINKKLFQNNDLVSQNNEKLSQNNDLVSQNNEKQFQNYDLISPKN